VKKPLKDAKSRLQEIVQSKGLSTPNYEVISESGPDHAKQFTIGVFIDNKLWGEGTGKNKSEGAQLAAKKAIDNFT
jgi:ribonuclease-3